MAFTACSYRNTRYKKCIELQYLFLKCNTEHTDHLPGKNPGENLCRDTVMTLEVKLKASSTPTRERNGRRITSYIQISVFNN